MTDENDTTTSNLAGCLIALLLTPFMLALRGWVLATLWRWLMVPIFGLPPLSVWQAIAVSTVVGIFTMRIPDKDNADVLESVGYAVIYTLLTYGAALFLGYIASTQI